MPFAKPEAEFDLLIGDWFEADYKVNHHHSLISQKFAKFDGISMLKFLFLINRKLGH